MKFTLEGLSQVGAFSGAPVKRQIKWSIKGEEHTADVWVRKLSYHSMVNEIQAFRDKRDGAAARIAACILNEKFEPIFTTGDITGDADPARGPLDPDLTLELLKLIGEANTAGKDISSPT